MPQPIFHVRHAGPLVGVRLQRLATGTSACRRRWSARRAWSCRSLPSMPMRSPRSSSWASSQPSSPTCFWPIITCTRLDQSVNSAASCLSSSLVVLRVVKLAGPVADVEPVDLAADAPADDAPGRLHRGALIFGHDRRAVAGSPGSVDARQNDGPTDRGRASRCCATSPVGCFRRHFPRRFSTFVKLGKRRIRCENMDCSRATNPVNCEWWHLEMRSAAKNRVNSFSQPALAECANGCRPTYPLVERIRSPRVLGLITYDIAIDLASRRCVKGAGGGGGGCQFGGFVAR